VKDSPTEVAAMTGGTFKIVGKITQVTSPASDVTWNAGDTNRQIVWSAMGTVTNVHIEFYDGTGWRDVVANSGSHVNGANTYEWTGGIPADVKTNVAKIRITDANYPETTFTTAYTFKILPKLQVDAPVLDQKLTVQMPYDNLIKWTQTQGTGVETVNVYYSTDDGVNWVPTAIAENQPVALGTTGINWTIPNAIGALVKIKVQDSETGFEAVNNVSSKFTIRGGIVFQVPQNGVNQTAATDVSISWQYTGSIVTFDIYYSVKAGAGVFPDDYVQIADSVAATTYCGGGTCSYTWPAGGTNDDMVLNTASVLVNNNELSSSLTYVSSEGTEFKRGALVSNLHPTNGEPIWAGTDYEITWVKDKGPSSNTKMKLEYSNNYSGARTWNPVLDSSGNPLDSVGNTGAAIWRVPKAYEDFQADLKLRITQVDPDNSAVQTLGAGTAFVIKAPITIVFPKGDQSAAERWGLLNKNRYVEYKKTGAIKKVIIMYSAKGDFTDEIAISPLLDISNQTTNPDDTVIRWNWNPDTGIPENTPLSQGFSAKVKVKVDDPQQQRGISYGISNGGFMLSGSISGVTPEQAVTLVGGFQQIRWYPLGSFSKFKVEYSYAMSGDPSWIEITPGSGVDGVADGLYRTWTWGPSTSPLTIPDSISNKVLFRVSDYNNPNTFCDSNDYQRPVYNIIKGTLNLVTPNDSPQTFYIGDQIPITWSKLGTIGNLLIQYTAKGDSSDLVTIDPAFASGVDGTNSLSPVWMAPSKVSENFRVKVSNTGAPAGTELSQTSTATFGVRPKITGITSPLLSGQSIWYVGEQKTITFSATSATKPDGSLPKVMFQYLVQGGSWTYIYETGHVGQTGHEAKFDCANGINNYVWDAGVADEFSETVKLKIFFEEYPNDINTSMESSNFKIRPQITLDPSLNVNTRPLAFSNNPNFVKWTYTGTQLESSSMNVRYDLFNGNGLDNIPGNEDDFAGVIADGVSATAGAAGVTWNNLPDVNNAVKIRVYDTSNPVVHADSPAFHIVAGLNMTMPINGVTWLAKSTTNSITWTFNGTVVNFKLYYDPNEGKGADGIPGNADDYNNHTPIGTPSQEAPYKSSGSMTWIWNPMPGTVTNKGVIKVTDADNESIVYSVGSLFKVGAKFDITDPEAGNTAYAEEDYTITWNNFSVNGVNNVALYYTNNPYANPVVWTPITANALNTGSFLWSPVPSALADLNNTNRVRITQYDPLNEDGTLNDSASDFAILAKLFVTAPAGDSWKVGESNRVKIKKKGALQTVDVYYSYDGQPANYVKVNGVTPVDISGAPNDSGTKEYWYDWTPSTDLALTVGTAGKVKVKAVTPDTQVSVTGVSSGFQLKGGISSVLPSGATDLEVTESKQISWTTSGLITKYRVYYRYNAGTWIEISPSEGVNSSPWTWNPVPDTISNDVDFKVEDYSNSNVSGESAVNNIIKGKLDMTAPNASVIEYIGDTIPITWTKSGSIGLLKIEYSAKGDFTDAVEITSGIDPNGLAYGPTPWTAPFKVSENFKVRISTTQAPAGAELTDQSTAAFKVRPKVTGITSPLVSGASVWNVGTQQSIAWNVTTAQKTDGSWPKVNLQYYDSAGSLWKDIPNSTTPAEVSCDQASMSYTWTSVADENDEATKIRIRFKDYTDDMTAGRESSTFSIRPAITLDPSINANLRLIAFSNGNAINWTYTGTKLAAVNVLYDLNNANTFAGTIASNVPVSNHAGTATWDNVPDINGSVKIRVIDTSNSNVKADSAVFKIIGGLVLTHPVGGETWKAKSTTHDIEWTFNGTIAGVKIYYDLNEGLGADGIADTGDEWGNNTPITTVAQTGSSGVKTYKWNPMPGTVTNKGVIKITDASNETDVYSIGGTLQKTLPLAAGQLFKVGAPFDITDPELGHTAYAEESHTITWNNYLVSGVAKVALYYTNNSGDPSPTWNLITNNIQNTGSYDWNPVPSALADLNNTNRVRITQYDPANEDATKVESEGDFSILGKLIVTVPSAGTESWGVNTTQRIKFKKKGALQTVDVYYSYDGQEGHYTKINSTAKNVSGAPEDAATGEYWYDWTIDPDTTILTSGFSGKIRVKTVTPTAQVSVAGDQQNAIEVKGTVTMLDPDGAITPMVVGNNYTVRWQKFGAVANVQIHYSTEGGIVGGGSYPDGNLIYDGSSTANGSTVVWSVPDRVGTNLRIRVRHKENPSVWNESTTAFRIKGKLQLTEPEGTGLSYTVGTTQTIHWTSTGTFGTSGGLELHYSRYGNFTGGDTYTVAPLYQVNNCAAAGTFPYQCSGSASFTIPDKITSAAKVRVRGTGSESDVSWISTNPFKIIGKIEAIAEPAAGAVWNVGDVSKQIKWTATGTITDVKIEYKTSLAGTWVDPAITDDDSGHAVGDNTYVWAAGIPNVKTNDAYIQISDVNYPEVSLVSSAFKILPVITVGGAGSSPTADEKVQVGINQPNFIKWTYTGNTISYVKIYYDTTSGTGGYSGIVDDTGNIAITAGTAGVSWNIPDSVPITNGARIKVVDAATGFSNVYGESPVYNFKGGLTLTQPLGTATTWGAETTNTISWNFIGAIPTVNIYYDLTPDDGDQWTAILPVSVKAQSGSSGTSSISWTLPTGVTNKARIRLVAPNPDADLVATWEASSNPGDDQMFRIGAQFDITAPENGAPVYAENTETQITWNTLKGTGINKVKLYYTNDLTNWIEITPAGGIANTGSYDWNPIPRALADLSTTTHRVKITQFDPANEAGAFDVGGGVVFPILGTLTVTTPSLGTESWGVNVPQTLKFKKKGNLQSADLYYSYDGGAGNYAKITPTPINISDATGVPDGNGNYSFVWTLDPATTALTNGFTGRIKAKAVDPSTQNSVAGISSAIEVKGTVTLLAPNGAVSPMVVGDIYTIRWEKFGAVNNVQIHYSTNGGLTYPDSDLIYDGPYDVNGSTFAWDVPNAIGTNVKIRIRHKENTNVKDESNPAFRIKGKLEMVQPENAGISWAVGSTQQIQWISTGTFTPLELQYATDGNFGGTQVFSVKPTATVTNCSPSAPAILCNGSATFEIEDRLTAVAKVRVRGTGTEQDVEAISGNTFKIVGALDVTAPETGQIWYVGETDKTITWTASGTVTNVNIGYKTSAAGGCNYTNIVANDGGHTSGSNSYAWTAGIPDERTEDAYICIQDKNFPEIVDVSAASFKIRPEITVTEPVAGTRIKVGSNNANLIKFSVTGTKTTLVDILYSLNNGTDNYPNTIASGVDVALGPAGIAWDSVPDTITPTAKIKVVDRASTNEVVFGLSPSFKIVGDITLITPPPTAPDPKIVLKKGQQNYAIQWIKKGSFPYIVIRYSLDGGTTFGQQITAQTAAGNSENPLEPNEYVWPLVPNTPYANVILRVANYDDGETKSLSAPFSIQSNLDITQPDNGEVWGVGTAQDIIWTTDGTTLRVNLEYAKNGGGANDTWIPVIGAQNILNGNTFGWTIPDAISNTVKVRVVDMADTTNWNESASTFKIRANYKILSPNGNADPALTDQLTVGTTVPIQWSVAGTVTTVQLKCSVDGGAYTTIPGAESLDSSGYVNATINKSWDWQVPDSISSAVRVRVVDADTSNFASSDYNFTIQGQLTFNPALPQSGDTTWYIGDTKTITWTKAGTIPLIKLQYSKLSNSSGFIDIEQNVGGLQYVWEIPKDISGTNVIAPNVWIRAVNMNDAKPTVLAVSGQIDLRGKFLLTSPVVTDKWQVDSSQVIQWTPHGTMGTVKLEYSVDNFVTPLPVLGPSNESAANLPAGNDKVDQSFSWKIPSVTSAAGNTVKVRISPNTVGQADVTASPVFKIVGGFKVLTPNGGSGQVFEVDGSTSITWERHGPIANAKLQYSTNGFTDETEVFDIATVTATDLSYTWTPIPDKIGTNVKVRIVDPLYDGTTVHTNADASDQTFEIRGKIDINSPVGGEIWLISEDRTLQWTKHGTIPSVKVEYDTDPADAYDFTDPGTGLSNYVKNAAGSPASAETGTSFSWRVPDIKSLNKVRIKVTNLSDPTHVFTISPFFTIRAGFTWTNPSTEGQVFSVGAQQNIAWATRGTVGTVNIKYFTEGNEAGALFVRKENGSEADHYTEGSPFLWKVPDNISRNIYLEIIDATDSDATATSAKIKIAGVLYVDKPNGTERWGAGTTQSILWHRDGSLANVVIDYSLDNGAHWVSPPITSSIIASLGTKSWILPATASPTVKVRISDAITDSGTAPAISPAFKIVGSFTFTAPGSGEVWRVTSGEIVNPTRDIKWITTGDVAHVNLRYSATGDAPWTLINQTPIANATSGIENTYAWTVPNAISSTVKLLVEDADDNETNQTSSAFSIGGDLRITSPVGGEKWNVDNPTRLISWQRNGNIDFVNLTYKKNSPTGFPSQIPTTPGGTNYNIPNDGFFVWTIPENALANVAYMEIKNVSGPSVVNQPATGFKIMAQFEVTDPAGNGEVAIAGANYTVKWNHWGNPAGNVKVDLALDGTTFDYHLPVIGSGNLIIPNTGSATFLMDEAWVTPTAKVRVYQDTDIDTAAASANPFTIRALFAFIEPDTAGQNLEVGQPFDIVWFRQGKTAQVKIEYSPAVLVNGNLATDIRKIEPTSDGLAPNSDAQNPTQPQGRYTWTVPDIEDNKDTNIHLRVMDPNDPGAYAISPAFNIIPKLTVTFPNGNANASLTEKFKVGTPYTITWTSSSSQLRTPYVTLSYTTTGGPPYDKTITTTDNTGSYTWVTANGGVPDTISSQVKIRVVDASDGVAYDDSDNNFKIISDFTISTPNGGGTYDIGDVIPITWTNKGTVANVQLWYSTGSAAFTNPVEIESSLANGSGFGTTYNWTVADAAGTTVRIKVMSTSDEGFDISDADFRVRGRIAAVAPVSTDKALIGQTFTIRWQTYGTMPTVKIDYDTNNGVDGYPNSIAVNAPNCTPVSAGVPCSGSFVWNNIPDTPAAQAKIRLMDARVGMNDVLAITDTFQIVGNVTVVSPNGGEDWRVNEQHNITWTWGGTIPRVKLYYTKETGDPETVSWIEIDPLVSKNYSTDGKQQNGANNTIQRSYNWTIPDDISPTVRVKVADITNASVYDVSNNTFKIRGGFMITSPNGNANIDLAERWVTSVYAVNEGHNIIWTTAGTVPNVKLQYSNDEFVSDIHEIVASTPNTGTYYWDIPDAVLKDKFGKYTGYNTVKVRVLDVNDEEVYDDSDNPFKIDYYSVTWVVRDLSTYNLLGDLGVMEVKTTDSTFIQWQEAGVGVGKPDPDGYTRIVPTPAGSWIAKWSKTGYGDLPQVVTLSQNNPYQTPALPLDPSYEILMETTTVHIYDSVGKFTYDPVADRLDIVAWLARDGSIITGVQNARIYIYDGTTIVGGAPIILIRTGSKETGLWNAQINTATQAPYSLQAGKTYVAKVQTQIASQVPNNVWYETPTSFEITTPMKLQEVLNQVNYALDKPISQVQSAIQNTLTAQTGTIVGALATQSTMIETKLTEQQTIIKKAVDDFNTEVQSSLVSLEAGAKKSLEAGESLKATAERFSWRTSCTPNPTLQNTMVTIAAQGLPGLNPLVSVYNYENKEVIASGKLIESSLNPGNYSFTFMADPTRFQAGKSYTFIVSEDTTGGLVGGSGTVESMSLTTIAGLVASAPGAESAAKKALDAIKGLEAVMTKGGDLAGVKDQIQSLKGVIDDLPTKLTDAMRKEGGMTDVKTAVHDISDQLAKLAGTEGYDFSKIMSKALSENPSIKEIRQKSDVLATGVDVVQKTLVAKLGGSDDPIVDVSYTSGSVVVRVVAVNPSETKTQEVPVKVYLPKEVTPGDVMDKGDLEFGFDEVKSIYFVYKDKVALAPKETRVFDVELKDIWFVPDETLKALRAQSDHVIERLKETPYFEQAKPIVDVINGRLDNIATSQADESLNKELHIGLYRSNLIVIEKIKEDLARLEKMLVAVGAPPAPEMLAESKLNLKTPSKATTWFIILAILIFIGLLGAAFFFTWQAQVRSSHGFPEDKGKTPPPPSDETPPPGASSPPDAS